MIKLRPYQSDLEADIAGQWRAGQRNVLAVLPTGGGKTVVLSKILHDHQGASCTIAHRQELVTQISMALNRNGVRHRIIGPKAVVKRAVSEHMVEMGRSYYDPDARCAVAGVDTLPRRADELSGWLTSVTLWVIDEGHHTLAGNTWGKAAALFPNARGLGVTATPCRADGKGLGRHSDGLFDTLVEGPTMRELVNAGYLTDYKIFAPPSQMLLTSADIGSTGDYKHGRVVSEFRKQKSRVIGDIVGHYLKHASGKLGITFVPDVEDAIETAAAFTARGVPAEAISAKTPDAERAAILRRFKRRELLQLVNVDLFGEGFDLPAIECVSMARPTMSYALYVQQFGRGLRLMDGKLVAVIIDHVGNVVRHGLPDAPQNWTLDARDKRGRTSPSDAIPVKSCPACTGVFERFYVACPYCGHTPAIGERSKPEHVDGDLVELDAETLAHMRGEIAAVDKPVSEYREELAAKHMPAIGQMANAKRHVLCQEAQATLRHSIAMWAGLQRSLGRPDRESHKLFFLTFGVDVLSAQALGVKPAEALNSQVRGVLPQ